MYQTMALSCKGQCTITVEKLRMRTDKTGWQGQFGIECCLLSGMTGVRKHRLLVNLGRVRQAKFDQVIKFGDIVDHPHHAYIVLSKDPAIIGPGVL